MRNLASVNLENDFAFVVGGHEYRCSRFEALFLSASVARQVSCDATVSRFVVDEDDGRHEFGRVISLARGGRVGGDLTRDELRYLVSVGRALENDDFLERALYLLHGGDDTIEAACDVLWAKAGPRLRRSRRASTSSTVRPGSRCSGASAPRRPTSSSGVRALSFRTRTDSSA